jgi:hypothetical protein
VDVIGQVNCFAETLLPAPILKQEMPCPYFEPQQVAVLSGSIRLPLIEEYDGICRAGSEPFPAPASLRFHCCNHGNSAGICGRFPAAAPRSSQRFDMTGSSPASLEILLVEELHYAPVAWRRVRYFVGSESLEPEVPDVCMRAQVIAFCRSFLKVFRPNL